MNLAEIKAAAKAARRCYGKPDLQFARATETIKILDAQDWLVECVEELAEAARRYVQATKDPAASWEPASCEASLLAALARLEDT